MFTGQEMLCTSIIDNQNSTVTTSVDIQNTLC